MEKYRRVEQPKQETPILENEIRVTTKGKMGSYISYATNILQTKKSNEIILKAMGKAIHKTVTIAEILKRRVVGLHQNTIIGSTEITDLFVPIEEGLDNVNVTRHVSSIQIVLSTVPLDTTSPGYQAPIPADQVKPLESQPRTPSNLTTRVPRGRGGYFPRGGGYHHPSPYRGRGGFRGRVRGGFRGRGRGGHLRGGGGGLGGHPRGGYHHHHRPLEDYEEHQNESFGAPLPPLPPAGIVPHGDFYFRGGRGGGRGGRGRGGRGGSPVGDFRGGPPSGDFRGGRGGGRGRGRGGRGRGGRGRGGMHPPRFNQGEYNVEQTPHILN